MSVARKSVIQCELST